MNQIRIITDSGADFGQDLPASVTVLPFGVHFEDASYLDGVDITHEAFYSKLETCKTLPTTSLISPAAFEDAFRQAVEASDQVVAITLSGALSGTFQSATIAAQAFPGKVFVVDSRSATLGQQILVRHAAELADRGMSASQLAEQLEQMKGRIHVLGIVNTLEYLKKGGRISAATAALGGLLSVKPVLAVKDGEVVMVGKARGAKNSCNYLISEIQSTPGIDFSLPLRLGYTGGGRDFLQSYIDASGDLYQGHENALQISTVGAAIGTHLGPGAILAAFFEKTSASS